MSHTKERKLWFDGPNYTADAVIIDPEAERIFLIQRGDTGQWALPGGFVDPGDDSPYDAAVREAKEEGNLALFGSAPLIFRGVVDDPRNSEDAWIETSAYLFTATHADTEKAGDDAVDVAWPRLDELTSESLYASHAMIIERALDHLKGQRLFDTFVSPNKATLIDAGHMEYNKSICEKDGRAVFAKQHTFERFDDIERANRSYYYLEKEAFTMAHLRQYDFDYVPDSSALYGDTLAMNALQASDGWKWRADPETIDMYIVDSLKALQALETVSIPADSFDIEPSCESFMKEGWQSFTVKTRSQLEQRYIQFLPRLDEASQETAHEMMATLDTLQRAAAIPHIPSEFVFCHHDMRQSNLAWHPQHGSKLVDWSWAGLGEPNSDSTSLLIDLHKSGHDISDYHDRINPHHCLTLMGFWLGHSTWPHRGNDTVRFQQFLSALSAYEVLKTL